MVAGKNYNIVTKIVKPAVATLAAVAVGSSVAAGMTRYVTYIKAQQGGQARNVGSKLWICSTTAAAHASTITKASAAAKIVLVMNRTIARTGKDISIPDYPDPENPLFTIAASKFLTVSLGTSQAFSASCTVLVQYYDQ